MATTTIRLQNAVQETQTEFPQAKIFLSAILPRKDNSRRFTDFNSKIDDINNAMIELSKLHEKSLRFIHNNHFFKPLDHHNYYLKSDVSGIHLNKEGQKCLLNNIREGIQKSNGTKRESSSTETPPSAEKVLKARRH